MKKISENKNRVKIFNLIPEFKFPHKDARGLAIYVTGYFRYQAENINIVFMNNKNINRLNINYLSHNYPTDVISFRINSGKRIEGEIYIGVEIAKSNSLRYNTGFYEEIRRLIIHGVLHLIGYDDKTQKERAKMTELENFFLEQFHT
jgi:rRNA maturation RNase YbeY